MTGGGRELLERSVDNGKAGDRGRFLTPGKKSLEADADAEEGFAGFDVLL